MKKFFYFIFLFLITSYINSLSQNNDTLKIKKFSTLMNEEIKIENKSESINLVNDYLFFDGFLIIKLDFNEKIIFSDYTFKTTAFWKYTLDNIEDSLNKFYFCWPTFDLISKSEDYFKEGKKNKEIIFFKYYKMFNDVNIPLGKCFLFNFQGDSLLNSSNLLKNDFVFTSKFDNKLHYIFVKCSFYTSVFEIINYAVIRNKLEGFEFIKILIPISPILEFKIINELNNDKFYKGGLIFKEDK